ncbi:MAG: multidrug effflux MFS transporter [Pseudolabrys sp.]|nr:multidrug effflux MFS transporter [Pseudolabrys sp.]
MLRPGTFALTVLLAALTAIGPLTTDMYLPSLPDIALQLDASTPQVQFTISAYLIGFAVGQIFYGPLSDRHGRKPVLLAAMALYCLATLLCALATSIEMLLVGRALQAIGGSGGIVLARAIVRDLYSGNRAGRELSLIGSVMALAPVFAPIAGGVLQAAFGWRSIFFALVAAGLGGIAVVTLLLPETLKTRATERVSLGSMLKSFGVVGRHPVYLAYLAMASTSYAGLFGWISGASFVLQNLYGLTPLNFGVAFALGSIGYMAGSAMAARLVVRLGLDRTIGIGSCALTAGGLGMMAAVAFGLTSAVSLVVPVAVYLAGLGMVLAQSIAGAMTPFPDRAGAASSLFGFVQQVLAAACGALVGWLLGENAWPVAGAVAFMGLATLLIWIFTRSLRGNAAKVV